MAGASATVNMKVEGLAQFRNQMNQSRAAVKALDAELKLNEAQVKANGQTAESLSKQEELLNKQIEEQKKIINSGNDALKKMAEAGQQSSVAYRNMQASVANASTQLLGMESKLTNLKTGMTNTASGAKEAASEIGNAGTAAGNLGTAIGNINNMHALDALGTAISGITTSIEQAIRKVAQLAKAIWQAEVDASMYADELVTDSIKYGLSTDELQQWIHAAKFVDTGVDAIINARKKLFSDAQNAAKGPEATGLIDIFDGVSVWAVDTAGNLRDINDIFWDVIDAFNGANVSNAEKEARAFELFGRSYDELLPLMKQGREQWEYNMADAPILSQESVEALAHFNDAYERLGATFETTKNTMLASAAPAMETIANALNDLLTQVMEWAKSEEGQIAIEKLGDAVAGLITELTNGNTTKTIIDDLTGAISGMTKVFQWIIDNKDSIKTALEIVFGVFATLKFTEEGVKIIKLCESIKSLAGINPSSISGVINAANGGGTGTPSAGSGGSNSGSSGGTSKIGKAIQYAAIIGAGVGIGEVVTDVVADAAEERLEKIAKTGQSRGAMLAFAASIASTDNVIDAIKGEDVATKEIARRSKEAQKAIAKDLDDIHNVLTGESVNDTMSTSARERMQKSLDDGLLGPLENVFSVMYEDVAEEVTETLKPIATEVSDTMQEINKTATEIFGGPSMYDKNGKFNINIQKGVIEDWFSPEENILSDGTIEELVKQAAEEQQAREKAELDALITLGFFKGEETSWFSDMIGDVVGSVSDAANNAVLSDAGEDMVESVYNGLEDSAAVLQSAGAWAASQIAAGVASFSFRTGGNVPSSYASNLFIENMNMGSGIDANAMLALMNYNARQSDRSYGG